MYLKRQWEEAAYNRGQGDQLVASSALLAEQTQRAQSQFDAQQKAIDVLSDSLRASAERERTLVSAVRDLQLTRQQAQQDISRLTPSEHKLNIERQLGGALEDPIIIAKADSLITDYPLLKRELDKTNEVIGEVRGQVTDLNNKVSKLEEQRTGLLDQNARVTAAYKQTIELLNRPKRRAWCLWLCKTKDKLTLPDPITLGVSND